VSQGADSSCILFSVKGVERIVERLATKAGLEDVRVTPHIIRHTFATCYKNGGDPFSLQRILGQSDIKKR